MNMWGFTPSLLETLSREFPVFLDRAAKENPLKSEFFLPSVVSAMLAKNEASVQVLPSLDKWYGVTYREDKPNVMLAITDMTNLGKYPRPLWP